MEISICGALDCKSCHNKLCNLSLFTQTLQGPKHPLMLRILDDIALVMNAMSVEAAAKVNTIVVIGPAMFGDIIDDYLDDTYGYVPDVPPITREVMAQSAVLVDSILLLPPRALGDGSYEVNVENPDLFHVGGK